nr:hypothetical protein [Candidatus Sigynarchaeum springense]
MKGVNLVVSLVNPLGIIHMSLKVGCVPMVEIGKKHLLEVIREEIKKRVEGNLPKLWPVLGLYPNYP